MEKKDLRFEFSFVVETEERHANMMAENGIQACKDSVLNYLADTYPKYYYDLYTQRGKCYYDDYYNYYRINVIAGIEVNEYAEKNGMDYETAFEQISKDFSDLESLDVRSTFSADTDYACLNTPYFDTFGSDVKLIKD